jgi:hypothetical protein
MYKINVYVHVHVCNILYVHKYVYNVPWTHTCTCINDAPQLFVPFLFLFFFFGTSVVGG